MAAHAKSLYVEIDIRGPIERIWDLTQLPDLHRQWDVRFTDIEYLPRPDPATPQRFLYATRIGMGLCIRGQGESVGTHDSSDGQRSSALRFWSDDPRSLIREGSGYWKYVPQTGGETVRFFTSYDYSVRFGLLGRWADRLCFRPLMGWATAWSFDRLRLWIEEGVVPSTALRRGLAYAIARLTIAGVWTYQGLVPKLLARHPDELAMLRDAGLSAMVARNVCIVAGAAEVVLGLLIVAAWHTRWPLRLTLAAMPIALATVAWTSADFLKAAFNPMSLNLALAALATIALLGVADAPSAARCRRRPAREPA